MLLLEVVLFLGFVLPLAWFARVSCVQHGRRRREQRRFLRDQEIRAMEDDLRL